jgi:hypothetical protein
MLAGKTRGISINNKKQLIFVCFNVGAGSEN